MKSISLDRDFETGIVDPTVTDGLGHELPSSSSDSAFEDDWEFFLCENEMLPASNWEDGFLKYKARMMGEPEDDPWSPCDPENSLDAEMEGVVVTSQLEEQIKICYGMVSRVFSLRIVN